MKRTPLRPKRRTPRRREAPRWSWEEWQAANVTLLHRAEGGCEWCGATYTPLDRHHRKRRRDGGDRLSNIVLLCRTDHAWATEHPEKARQVGLIVSVARDPAEVPFLWRRHEWVWLDDDGSKRIFLDPMPTETDAHDVWA